MSGPHTGLNSTCRKAGGILEVLPESLSTKARQEINKACSELARKAKDKTQDLEHVARGELGKVSKETQKELAELARDLGQKHSHTPRRLSCLYGAIAIWLRKTLSLYV